MKNILVFILLTIPVLSNEVSYKEDPLIEREHRRLLLGYDIWSQRNIYFIAFNLDIPEQWLYDLFYLESRHNEKAVNDFSGATGLIQIMPNTAISLGTTTDKLYNMNKSEQVVWVYEYLKDKVPFNSFYDLYLAVLYPKSRSKPVDYVIGGKVTYSQNQGIDIKGDNNGILTVSDVYLWIESCLKT